MSPEKKTLSERKREAILEAAKSAFQIHGVQGTSMDKLAELANVSKRTVYNHFDTKEQLVFELLSEQWHQSMTEGNFEYQADGDLQQQLTQMLLKNVQVTSSDQFLEISRMVIGHFLYRPEALKKEVDRLMEQETVFHRWIKAAQSDNRIKVDDVDFANQQLHDLLKGQCFWGQMLKCEDILDEAKQQFVAEETAKMFLSRYAV